MNSKAFESFNHAIKDASDLMGHFDSLNKMPPPPEIEVLKRASLVMALAALESYFEDRITEAVSLICDKSSVEEQLKLFYKNSLESDLKHFHSPSVDRVKAVFQKFLGIDITEAWKWNNYTQDKAKIELNRLVKKRGDIAHRSLRPAPGQPVAHAVTKDDMRKHINFIKELVKVTDAYLDGELQK